MDKLKSMALITLGVAGFVCCSAQATGYTDVEFVHWNILGSRGSWRSSNGTAEKAKAIKELINGFSKSSLAFASLNEVCQGQREAVEKIFKEKWGKASAGESLYYDESFSFKKQLGTTCYDGVSGRASIALIVNSDQFNWEETGFADKGLDSNTNKQRILCAVGKGVYENLRICTTHLVESNGDSSRIYRDSGEQCNDDDDNRCISRHSFQLEQLKRQIGAWVKKGETIILAGDLNQRATETRRGTDSHGDSYQEDYERVFKLRDVLTKINGDEATYKPGETGKQVVNIDHIYAGPAPTPTFDDMEKGNTFANAKDIPDCTIPERNHVDSSNGLGATSSGPYSEREPCSDHTPIVGKIRAYSSPAKTDAINAPLDGPKLFRYWRHPENDPPSTKIILNQGECGAPVYAPFNGRVEKIVNYEDKKDKGTWIELSSKDGPYRAFLGSLLSIDNIEKVGDPVLQGQQIGRVGKLGTMGESECHLPFRLYMNDEIVDPWPLIAE